MQCPKRLSIAAGLLAASLCAVGCGARSAAHRGDAVTSDGAVPRPDRPSMLPDGPLPADLYTPDVLPPKPDLPPPPEGFAELTIASSGLLNDIRGLSDTEVYIAGQQPTQTKAMVWRLQGGAFLPVDGPESPYPLESLWVQETSGGPTLWAVGQRRKKTEAAIWRRSAEGRWTAERTPTPTLIHLFAVDGSSAGEVFAVGKTGNLGLAFSFDPKTGDWTEQRFSDAFQWIEARDVAVAGPGVAYAVGQRSSRLRFWLFKNGVWHLDQGLPGIARTVCVTHDGPAHQPYAGGSQVWKRDQSDWLPLSGSNQPTNVVSMRSNGERVFASDGSKLWSFDGTHWRAKTLPQGEKPRALWVSKSWLWVTTQTGRVWRHHVQTF